MHQNTEETNKQTKLNKKPLLKNSVSAFSVENRAHILSCSISPTCEFPL